MASLVKQHGRYYLQFYAKNRIPQRKRIALKTDSKRVATRRLRKLEGDYVLGTFDPWVMDAFTYDKQDQPVEAKTLQDAIAAFLAQKEYEGCRENTVRSYRGVLRRFAGVAGEKTPLCSVRGGVIDKYVKASDLAQHTQHKRYRHIKTFIRWCRKKGYLVADPLAELSPPSKPDKLPKAISLDELKRICQCIRSDYEGSEHRRAGELIWYIPLFRFAFYTGMRVSELGRLRCRDISHKNNLITIREQKNKKEQTIPLNAKAREVLEGIEQGHPDDYVFRSPRMTEKSRSIRSFRETVSRAFTKYRREAGINKRLTFHSLRHGFATALAEAGKSAVIIKEACRHADIKTSMIYVHMTNEHLKSEMDDVFS